MPNLPAIGLNPWETALNNYLSAVTLVANVKDSIYAGGAKGDGVTDDTAAIAAVRSAVNAVGGGVAYYPPGTYISGNQPIYAKVLDAGAGIDATTIKLKNNVNTDLFSGQTGSINLSAAFGAGSAGTLYNFGFMNLTLDGNKANQSSGPSYPLRFYGYGYVLQNVRIKNGYSGGWLSDWNGGSNSPGNDSMEAQVINVKIHDCNGVNFQFGGPHDSQFTNFISYLSGSHCMHLAPNCGGTQFDNTHLWGPATGNSSLALLCEAGAISFGNSQAEGSDTLQVAVLASDFKWFGGRIFAAGNYSCSGVKIGQQASETPYSGQLLVSSGTTTAQFVQNVRVETDLYRNEGTHGSIWFDADGGQNVINVNVTQFAGSYFTGTPDAKTLFIIHGNGLTADGTQNKGGGIAFPINAFSAFTVRDHSYNDIFNVNTFGKAVQFPVGTQLVGYSDSYSTLKWVINQTGNGEIKLGNASSLYSGSGAPSSGLGSNGDFYFRSDTPGTANQRIYVKSGGSWIGIV